MAWQVAIVFDEGAPIETLHANLYILLGQMPVWAITQYGRVPDAAELREQWNSCWRPEPALTLALPTTDSDRVAEALALIPTIQDHHSRMSAVRFFGIERSLPLVDGMANLGFHPITGTSWDGLGFAKPLCEIEEVPNVVLDAVGWETESDFYNAFFNAVGAPEWHGRGFDALNDSIGTGEINKLEVPYRLILTNASTANAEVAMFIDEFSNLIKHLQVNGCPVDLLVE